MNILVSSVLYRVMLRVQSLQNNPEFKIIVEIQITFWDSQKIWFLECIWVYGNMVMKNENLSIGVDCLSVPKHGVHNLQSRKCSLEVHLCWNVSTPWTAALNQNETCVQHPCLVPSDYEVLTKSSPSSLKHVVKVYALSC